MNISTLRQTRPALLVLLALLGLCGFELLAPADRSLWLLTAGVVGAGAFLRPPVAAALGWLLVPVLAAYLLVNTTLSASNGAGWLTLMILPWLPVLMSNVVGHIREADLLSGRQAQLLAEEVQLHPLTELPGLGLARQFLSTIRAAHRRVEHHTALLEVRVSNLPLLHTLYPPEEARSILTELRDVLSQELRGSDWLFHLTDDRFLIMADIGTSLQGAQVLTCRIGQRLLGIKRAELSLRSLLLWSDQPSSLAELLESLSSQPAQDNDMGVPATLAPVATDATDARQGREASRQWEVIPQKIRPLGR